MTITIVMILISVCSLVRALILVGFFYLLLHPSQEVIWPGQQTNPGAATVTAPKKFRTPKPHSQAPLQAHAPPLSILARETSKTPILFFWGWCGIISVNFRRKNSCQHLARVKACQLFCRAKNDIENCMKILSIKKMRHTSMSRMKKTVLSQGYLVLLAEISWESAEIELKKMSSQDCTAQKTCLIVQILCNLKNTQYYRIRCNFRSTSGTDCSHHIMSPNVATLMMDDSETSCLISEVKAQLCKVSSLAAPRPDLWSCKSFDATKSLNHGREFDVNVQRSNYFRDSPKTPNKPCSWIMTYTVRRVRQAVILCHSI